VPQDEDFELDEWGNLTAMMAAVSAEQMRQLNDQEHGLRAVVSRGDVLLSIPSGSLKHLTRC
jgi:hypothetical protein